MKKAVLLFFLFSFGLALNINAAVVKKPKIVGNAIPELARGKARLFIGGDVHFRTTSFSNTGQVKKLDPPRTTFHLLEQQQDELIPIVRMHSAIYGRLPNNRFYIDIDAGEKVLAFYYIHSPSSAFLSAISGSRPEGVNKAKYLFQEGRSYYFKLGLVESSKNKKVLVTNFDRYELDLEKMQFCQSLRSLKKSERPKSKQLKKMYQELGIESWAEQYTCQLSFQAKPYTMSEKRKKSMNKFISSHYQRLMQFIDYKRYIIKKNSENK